MSERMYKIYHYIFLFYIILIKLCGDKNKCERVAAGFQSGGSLGAELEA